MTQPEFVGWSKTARLFREVIVTEKIDGTNAGIVITEDGEVFPQSRNRYVTVEADNQGFAFFVKENEDSIRELLGPGTHYGEWYGSGIGKRYKKLMDSKLFALFNTERWQDANLPPQITAPPILYQGTFNSFFIDKALNELIKDGSKAVPGAKAEGIIIHHVASQTNFKVTCENDEKPKASKELG